MGSIKKLVLLNFLVTRLIDNSVIVYLVSCSGFFQKPGYRFSHDMSIRVRLFVFVLTGVKEVFRLLIFLAGGRSMKKSMLLRLLSTGKLRV